MQTPSKSFTRADIISEAKTWIGTPFKHQGRIKGVGVDCAGLVIGIAHVLQISTFDCTTYSHMPDGVTLRRLLGQHLRPKFVSGVHPGDILLLRFDAEPQHLAILSDHGIIHAYAQVRRCCEHRLDAVWRSRIVSAYVYPGIEN
jgi:NlpC/P60 family putative phage cell wall peptidase